MIIHHVRQDPLRSYKPMAHVSRSPLGLRQKKKPKIGWWIILTVLLAAGASHHFYQSVQQIKIQTQKKSSALSPVGRKDIAMNELTFEFYETLTHCKNQKKYQT